MFYINNLRNNSEAYLFLFCQATIKRLMHTHFLQVIIYIYYAKMLRLKYDPLLATGNLKIEF